MIHPQAVVSTQAEIDTDVVVGPFSVIEAGATIGAGCRLASGVVIKTGTTLGRNNHVFEGAVIGGLPQHVEMPECPGRLEIGNDNIIRENVTIQRSLFADGITKIGDACLFMVNAHVAHDCQLGDQVILTNNVMLAGHVEIGARAYLAGAVAVHQFCRIGRLAMVGGLARVRQDIPPFVTVDGGTDMVVGLNRVGLRRAGLDTREQQQLKAAYRVIYRSGLLWNHLLSELERQYPSGPAAEFAPFFRSGKRGFVQERRTPPGAIVRLLPQHESDERRRKAG